MNESFNKSDSSRPQTTGQSVGTTLAATLDNIGVTRSHKMILLLCVIGAFFDVIEQNTIGIVGPLLQESWGISTVQVGYLSTATFASMYVGAVLGGWLADIRGRRVIFAFNLGIYSVGGLVCAFAPSLSVLLIGRIIVGIGLGGELAVGITLLAELNATRARGTMVSLFNVGAGGLGNPAAYAYGLLVIGVLGPVLPLFLGGPAGSWRWVFGFLALPAVLILYIRRYLPETPRYLVSKGRISEANRTLSILSTGRLNPKGLQVTRYLNDDARDEVHSEKTRPWEIFKRKYLSRSIVLGICGFMLFGAQFVMLTYLPTLLVSLGYEIATSLAFTMLIYVGAFLGAIASSYLNFYLRRKLVVGGGAALALIFALLFGFVARGTISILVIGFLFQFFVLLVNTALWTWVPEAYPTKLRASGTGILTNLGLIAGSALPPLAGALLALYGAPGLLSLVGLMYLLVVIAVPFGLETFGRSLEELHGVE